MTTLGHITALLKPEYREAGYSITETEDFLELCHNGKHVAVFNAHRNSLDQVNKYIESLRTCEVCGKIGVFGSLFDKSSEIVESDYRTPTGHEGTQYACKDVMACLDRHEASLTKVYSK